MTNAREQQETRGTELYDGRTFSSFSGADITVSFYVPPEQALGLNLLRPEDVLGDNDDSRLFSGRIQEDGGFLVAGNLQTISISSARTVVPVRRLGESNVEIYTAGPRTIAGSMIFTLLVKNAFTEIYRRSRSERVDEEFFVDMLPPFTVIITAANEFGTVGRQVLDGVKLVNTGVTYSVDDLYTEETYSYVATHASPFLPLRDRQNIEDDLNSRRTALEEGIDLISPRSVSDLSRGRERINIPLRLPPLIEPAPLQRRLGRQGGQ